MAGAGSAFDNAGKTGQTDKGEIMSHTPGEWHWDSDLVKGDPLNRRRYKVTTIGKTITQLYHSSGDLYAEADARLIAAAPELLYALKSLMDSESRARIMPIGPEWDIARAAIAKAEGAK